MKRLLALALVFAVPASAHDLVYDMTGDRTVACQATRDKPDSRGFKIARKVDAQTVALQQVRERLVARNPKDRLIKVIDKAITHP